MFWCSWCYFYASDCVFLCMWMGEGRQGVWMLLRTSRALQEQSACPSTMPALKHTQDKLILQSLTLSAPTHSTQPLTPPLPGRLSISIPASHSHVPPASDPLLPLHDRSRTLLVLVQPSICSCTDYKRFHSSNCPHPLLAANIFMWCNWVDPGSAACLT